jgi:hypothetical protein
MLYKPMFSFRSIGAVLQTQTNLIKQPPAAIFCSLPFIAECFVKFFLQFVSLTFMVTFS